MSGGYELWRNAEKEHSLGNFDAAKTAYTELLSREDYHLRAAVRLVGLTSPAKTPINLDALDVVWQTGVHGKGSIVRELVSSLPIRHEIDDSDASVPFQHVYGKVAENMVLVDHRIFDNRALQYYIKCRQAGAKIILIHLADEAFLDLHDLYEFCDVVYRNYWSPVLALKKNVRFFPLGPASQIDRSVVDSERPMGQRGLAWNFLGDVAKDSRKGMVEVFQGLSPHRTHLVADFFDQNKLGPSDYNSILSDSKFTLCPDGYSSRDTFRFWESIELGSIPISIDTQGFRYFQNLLGCELPFPQFASWGDALHYMQSVVSNVEYLNLLQVAIRNWWRAYKERLVKEFRETCLGLAA